jgi:hypothetical protein
MRRIESVSHLNSARAQTKRITLNNINVDRIFNDYMDVNITRFIRKERV